MNCDDLCGDCYNVDNQLHDCNRCKYGNYINNVTKTCQKRYDGCAKEVDELDCIGYYPNRLCKCKFCEYGYRLIHERCYKCFDHDSGFIHCAGQCSNDATMYSNVRNFTVDEDE